MVAALATLLPLTVALGCGGSDSPSLGDADAGTPTDGAATTDAGPDATNGGADGGGGGVDSGGSSADGGKHDAGQGTDSGGAVDSGGGGAGDAASTSAPVITILTPPTNTTLNCKSTTTYDFSASVVFGAPFQSVTFDYVDVGDGSNLAPAPAHHVFTAYANPFAETVQIGGANSLCTLPNAIPPRGGDWIFRVTAVDTLNHQVVAQMPFKMVFQ